MPTYKDYAAKYAELGSIRAVARHYGTNYSTVHESLNRQWEKEKLSPGIKDALTQTGIDADSARFGYRKVKDPETGSFNTVFWRTPEGAQENLAERLTELMQAIPLAPVIELESEVNSDLMSMIAIADAHLGLRAWGRETGEDWTTSKGVDRLVNWTGRVLNGLQPASRCILLLSGDLLHVDDNRAETPASKHRLDVDTTYFELVEMVIEAVALTVDMALRTHENVVLRVLPGNHDPHSSITVMLALAQRYRETPRVTVQRDPSEFFIYQFGEVLIAAHHGHRAKAPQRVHFIADEYAVLWGKTRHRYLFTGHLHHHKLQDIGGMTWEQLPAITARDTYTTSSAYVARARLMGITYHRNRGETARIIVGPDT